MAKSTSLKTLIRRKTSKKKKSGFSFKSILFFLFLIGILFSAYHYRNALSFYFKSQSNKNIKVDKVAQARIYQILNAHKDLTFGIDVSQFQGEINWDEVDSIENKFPIKFIFIRASAGSNKKDRRFEENCEQAKSHHFICGAYHYYRPNENSIEQADNFINAVSLKKGDLPPVLDIEKLPENQSIDSLKVGLKRWLDRVDAHYSVRPIIYTGEKYYTDFLKEEFKGYTFWIANYNFFVENIKDEWLFWQFTQKARIKGIDENVDVNIYNGTPKMLQYLTISN
jgi:lysozyme